MRDVFKVLVEIVMKEKKIMSKDKTVFLLLLKIQVSAVTLKP